jgi:hypothetical protein
MSDAGPRRDRDSSRPKRVAASGSGAGSGSGWGKLGIAVAIMAVGAVAAYVYQLYQPKLINLANASEEQLRTALTGVDPHVFYCQEGIEQPPPLFLAASQQRGSLYTFATLNCSQVLPSGKSILSKFGLKRQSRQPIVFGAAAWAKAQQVPKASLVDATSLVSFIDLTFAPKPYPVSSDKELNKFCGFAKDVATARHSVTTTCIVLQKGSQFTDYHSDLAARLVRSYPRSKVAVIDASARRFSFEHPQNAKPAEDISLEVFAIRNGTHFLQMNNKALTWDYVNTFVASAIATPLYGFDEEPYGAVRLVKPSKKSQFKDRSQRQQQQQQQDEQQEAAAGGKSRKGGSSGSKKRSAESEEGSPAGGNGGKDNTGDRIRAERRAKREAAEREQRERQQKDPQEDNEEEEEDTEDDDSDEDIIEL